MTDIDFDELDKAVNSLMDKHDNQTADAPPPSTSVEPRQSMAQDTPPTQAVQAPARELAPPVDRNPVDATPSVTTQTPASAKPFVVPQRTGRFMDVVTSSGSGRTAPDRPAPSARPSREATNLQPPSQQDPIQDAMVLDAATPDAVAESPEFSSTFAEPPKFARNEVASFDEPVEVLEPAPLESPFIDGIEVDKRPLGFSKSDASSVQLEQAVPSEDQQMVDPIEFDGSLEPNLETQPTEPLNNLESFSADPWSAEGEKDKGNPPEPVRPELNPELIAVESAELSPEPEVVPASPPAPVIAENPAPQPTPQGNINPQYQTAANDAPEPSAIFEAASSDSPKPLAHSEKKKSGWMAIVWILLLVVVGAGGGVAAWFFLLR